MKADESYHSLYDIGCIHLIINRSDNFGNPVIYLAFIERRGSTTLNPPKLIQYTATTIQCLWSKLKFKISKHQLLSRR